MPIDVPYLGKVSFMRIGKRQLKYRGIRKRNKPLFVLKKTSIPSESPYILEQWVALARVATMARGKPYEEVMENYFLAETLPDGQPNPMYGEKVPEEVKKKRKLKRYERADRNLKRMEERLAKYHEMTRGEFIAAETLRRF